VGVADTPVVTARSSHFIDASLWNHDTLEVRNPRFLFPDRAVSIAANPDTPGTHWETHQ